MSTTASQPQQQRCQRIGCDAIFNPENNPEDGCHYHPGPPLFHDGGKEWSCCKQRSHDFSLFLAIPGCSTGKHTSEKPQMKAAPSPNKSFVTPVGNSGYHESRVACSRCSQGFFCSDHGSRPATNIISKPDDSKERVLEAPKVIDLNAQQVCKNLGCGKTFTEKENHDTACNYHPGPAVFHDRSRGWACCDVHDKEFDDFLAIPPCTKGWHSANPERQ